MSTDYSVPANRIERKSAIYHLQQIEQNGFSRYANNGKNIARKIKRHCGVDVDFEKGVLWIAQNANTD